MYYKRLIEKEIELDLEATAAILVKGPKYCGKTTTCRLFSKSEISLTSSATIDEVNGNPYIALNGEKPRLIDEWEKAPEIFNLIKASVKGKGEYILTGSSTPADKKMIQHNGAGRIVSLMMKPMSLYESLDSKGTISIKDLFDGKIEHLDDPNSEMTLEKAAFLVCRGGWPDSLGLNDEIAIRSTRNYYKGLFDFENIENEELLSYYDEEFIKMNPDILKAVVKSYARNISTEASLQTILRDVRANDRPKMNPETLDKYIDALKKLYIIEDMESWNPNLRSKTAIRSTPTRHFVDTSIACAALNISPSDLLSQHKLFGYFFEDMAVRDLSIYTMYDGGKLYHYRDAKDRECDAIIKFDDGRWAAVEIKLGTLTSVNEGIAKLEAFVNDVDDALMNKPCFKMILTAYGYPRITKEGIIIVPINLLRP